MSARASCIYVMARSDGAHKVGISVQPEVRRKQIAAFEGEVALLRVCETAAASPALVERVAHALLREKRRGGEWFDVSLTEAEAAIRQAIGLVEADDLGLLERPEPVRLDIYPSAELRKALDRWRIEQPDAPSRAEAARRLLEKALKAEANSGK